MDGVSPRMVHPQEFRAEPFDFRVVIDLSDEVTHPALVAHFQTLRNPFVTRSRPNQVECYHARTDPVDCKMSGAKKFANE